MSFTDQLIANMTGPKIKRKVNTRRKVKQYKATAAQYRVLSRKLNVLRDAEAIKTMQKLFSMVADDEHMEDFMQFMTDLDNLMVKYRGRKPLDKQDLKEFKQGVKDPDNKPGKDDRKRVDDTDDLDEVVDKNDLDDDEDDKPKNYSYDSSEASYTETSAMTAERHEELGNNHAKSANRILRKHAFKVSRDHAFQNELDGGWASHSKIVNHMKKHDPEAHNRYVKHMDKQLHHFRKAAALNGTHKDYASYVETSAMTPKDHHEAWQHHLKHVTRLSVKHAGPTERHTLENMKRFPNDLRAYHMHKDAANHHFARTNKNPTEASLIEAALILA